MFCGTAYSQKYEMGKVSIKELQEKRHAADTAAAAAVIYKKAKTSFKFTEKDGFVAVHDIEMRIKIYKKEGLSLANYEIPYYVGYENINQDNLTLWEATTYNAENGKIEKTKLTGSGTFKEKVNEKWKVLTFTLPNVRVGSVLEFKYSIRTENIESFPLFEFQREIPVNYAEYRTEIPAYYIYKRLVKGFVDIKSDSKVESATRRWIDDNHNPQTIDYLEINSTHIAKDIPAIKKEDYVDNIQNYTSSIDYELEVLKRTNEPDKNIAKTWEGVTKSIYDYADFGKQLNTRQYFEGDLKTILKGTESQEEKINAIFNFVKAKVKWNKKFGIYTDVGVKEAYQNRVGNVAEINFILISMLNYSGLISYPVLVSTVNNGITSYPNKTAFNYIVASVQMGGKRVLLDAAGEYTAPGILPEYALNWTGRLIREHGDSEAVDMVPAISSKNTITVMSALDATGKISGKARIIKTDYEALAFRRQFAGLNRDIYLEKLENKYYGMRIANYEIQNEKNNTAPIQETFEFTSDNVAEIIGDKMYIYPLLFFTQTKNPFVQDERKLPVFFGYPKQNKYTLNIDLPEGYTVESIPAPISITTGEGVGSFKFNIQASGNKIQVLVTSELNRMLVAAEFYSIIKDYYKKIIDKQNEKIILKKI